ncbi:Oidioi.mRNA.OKI2018_I69.chr2.g4853.t1.cds [Oikopleura dioica]|uniref:Oxidation resistance protein 1 n=1 Tax=Oikopleura dioica TaxID=34765 RepID=A0ABN7T1Y5_OIKDI|nr:Oidioi.mRNA.OKI2018_I69.chr2.g4853.t1.cds [Oikopleura dioica]
MSSKWVDYEVDESDSLQTIAIKFDAPVSALKSRNRISDSSDLWTGRVIKVPENPDLARNDEVENGIDETPEAIGFIKLDAFKLRPNFERSISLSEIDVEKDCVAGVLLITPCALMFDPSQPDPENGLILPMADVKRAALYNSPSNAFQSWLQVSGSSPVSYFSISSSETSPILTCLQKWSPARQVATPGLKAPKPTPKQAENHDENEENSEKEKSGQFDVAYVSSASYLEENEEFFSSVEKSWQIESYSEFESEWTKVDKDKDEEPEMIDEIPDMTCSSDILNIQQVAAINQFLPARCIGSKWMLKYSSRNHGTSIGTLYRQAAKTSSPNLLIIKTLCGSTIGALASHPLKVQEHFFGSGESFLFRFKKSNSADDFAQFPWSGKNNFFTRCTKDTLVFGSSEGDYAIWIPDNLLRGTSKPCETFMNPTLTREKDFQICDVELWAFSDI